MADFEMKAALISRGVGIVRVYYRPITESIILSNEIHRPG